MSIIQNPIKYVAELFRILPEFSPIVATATNEFSKVVSIYEFSIEEHPTSSYWIDWGGTYDNPEQTYGIQLFFNFFIREVMEPETLLITDNSFYVDTANDIIYLNLPLAPWQYFDALTAAYDNTGSSFATAPKDVNNLSDIFYGGTEVDVRMSVPSLKNKLNDIVSGVRVYNSFQFTVKNDDGKFDDFDVIEYFNTPCRFSKSTELTAESLLDFNRIRFGLVNDIEVSFDKMTVTAVDQIYTLNNDVCRKFSIDDFGEDIDPDIIDEDVPVGWGTLRDVELIEIRRLSGEWIEYIALDPTHLTSVQTVYDSDGNVYPEVDWTLNTDGRIVVSGISGGEVIEAQTADVTGRHDSRVGRIVIDVLSEKENLPYAENIWDVEETNRYLDVCASVGKYFDSGDTKKLIEEVLENDLAFLIQKNSGVLTLRRWGMTYTTHKIPSWAVTKRPGKDFKTSASMYSSSIRILYNRRIEEDVYDKSYIDRSKEIELTEKYRRSRTGVFETDIISDADAVDFASRLIDRFGSLKETLSIGLAYDTFEIDLLDTIQFEGVINNREFSVYSTWIVTEADPGQDEIKIEGDEIYYRLSFDNRPAILDEIFFWQAIDVD